MVKLTAELGDLYLDGQILIYRYPEGDCDTVSWPFLKNDKARLASILYGEYECGLLHTRTVLLPDETKFNIDDNLRQEKEHRDENL